MTGTRHMLTPFDPKRDRARHAGHVLGERQLLHLIGPRVDLGLTPSRSIEKFKAGTARLQVAPLGTAARWRSQLAWDGGSDDTVWRDLEAEFR